MYFAMLPPEINSGRMYTGPGSGPMLAAAWAWDGLAADLYSTAISYSSVISGLAGEWLGPSSTSMAAAAAPYMAWLHATAEQCEQTAAQAKGAAAAFEAAFSMTIPPPVIAANRAELIALEATNFLGQNTPAIATVEAHYAEMWAQDVAAMTGYASASATASRLSPFIPPRPTTNPTGLAGQAAAVTQAAITPAGAGAQTMMSAGSQLMSLVPRTLQGLVSTGASDPSSLLPSSALQYLSLLTPYTAAVATTRLGITAATAAGKFDTAGDAAGGSAEFGTPAGESNQALGMTSVLGSTDTSGVSAGGGATAVTADAGRAASIGGLTVPPSWAAGAPTVRLVAAISPTNISAAPTVAPDSPGSLLSDMAAARMAGQAMAATACRGRPGGTPSTVVVRHLSAG